MTAGPETEPVVDGRTLSRASMVKELRKRGMEPVRRAQLERPDTEFEFPVLKTARR